MTSGLRLLIQLPVRQIEMTIADGASPVAAALRSGCPVWRHMVRQHLSACALAWWRRGFEAKQFQAPVGDGSGGWLVRRSNVTAAVLGFGLLQGRFQVPLSDSDLSCDLEELVVGEPIVISLAQFGGPPDQSACFICGKTPVVHAAIVTDSKCLCIRPVSSQGLIGSDICSMNSG